MGGPISQVAPTEHEFSRNSVGKGNILHAVFGFLLGHIRMDLEAGTLLYQEIKKPHSLC